MKPQAYIFPSAARVATLLLFVAISLVPISSQAQAVTTFAGNAAGYVDATGTAARFNTPTGIVATAGGVHFVADNQNHRIRRISSAGAVTTHAGSGVAGFADAMGTAAQFNSPAGVAMDGANIIVADAGNNRIRRINAGGNVTTVAGSGLGGLTDGTAVLAQFNQPAGVAVDGGGNIYVADFLNHAIRRIDGGGNVTTLAGNGTAGYLDATGAAARFNFPSGVAVDGGGNVFVADRFSHTIRRITPGGVVTTFAGGGGISGWVDGTGTAARFNQPTGLSFDALGNLIVADAGNHRIRQITPAGVVTTIAGDGTAAFLDATGLSARFNTPSAVTVSGGSIFVADRNNHRIREIAPIPAPTITTISPTIAGAGMTVIITGTNLSGAGAVTFGGVAAASFVVVSATRIDAVVAAGSASGSVAVTTAGGTATLAGFTFIPPPTITGFTPMNGGNGSVITVNGTNFIAPVTASFGGTAASSVAIISAAQVNATVAAGASGNVQITTSGGTVSLAGFTFIPAPTVTGFTPTSAPVGATITINGTNFTGVTGVTFGSMAATGVTFVSPTQVTAVVTAAGASGAVAVTTSPGGTGSLAGFTFIAPPTITGFTPANGGNGTTITINGTNLSGATLVTVGGTPATILTNTGTVITATVGAGATGTVQVTNPGGMATSAGTFTWFPAPTITTFAPMSAAAGAMVTINGTNFPMTPLPTVSFGGIPSGTVTYVSPTQITAVVAAGGATGNVQVQTPGGTANSPGFTFLPSPPTITGFTPATRCPGGVFTVNGTNFVAPVTVTIGGTAAAGVTVISPTQLSVTAGAGTTGVIGVTTPGGTVNSAGTATIVPTPTITGFAPMTQVGGMPVVITGSGFTGVTGAASVRFGGINAQSYTVDSDTQITAVVATNAMSGNVVVTSPGGCTATLAGFMFTAPLPTITSFTPTAAVQGMTITITGTGFTGTTGVAGVRFGGVNAASYAVISDTQINAVVPAGAGSGNVTVNAPGGTANSAGFQFVSITGFTPAAQGNGGTVTITGTNLTAVTAVRFGGASFALATPAASFIIVSATQINATLGAGATGNVRIGIAGGNTSMAGFNFVLPPTITGFTPTIQGNGGTVTINGANFIAAPLPTVSFGGVPGTGVTWISASQITANVAGGATGNVQVTTPGGTASQAGFTFLPPPTITSFSPLSAAVGATVTINGTNFVPAPLPTVNFGGGAGTGVTYISPTQITAVVGAAAASGNVQVNTIGGTANAPGFLLLPNITSFAPMTAGAGMTVTINGTGFTGATLVRFGGVAAASHIVVSATQITAVVPVGGLSGSIQVTTPGGVGSLAGFTFVPPPTITSFTPTSTTGGVVVTINGTNLSTVTGVSFGGTAATGFTPVSATQITATVSFGGSSGAVQVTTLGGTASSPGFTFIPLPPTITSFTPTSAASGATVTINGTNFAGVSIVRFGGVDAASYTVISPTQINAVVAAGGATGVVRVTALGGTIMTGTNFTFIPPPTITGFTPLSAGPDSTVTITGTNFTGATAVTFGGVAAASFVVVSATQITAVVAAGGASGNIQVTTPGGTATRTGFTFLPAPTITSFTPTSGAMGATITINGTNFAGVTQVRFGGVNASGFTVISATQITATVAGGATGNIEVVTSGGTALSAGTFTHTAPPNITSFTPATASQGATVVINGSNFTGATAVSFGGTLATSFTVLTDNFMTAVVGTGSSGNLQVTGPGGIGTRPGFMFQAAPIVTSFTPTSAGPGMTVVINGSGFLGATSVLFGGTVASSITVVSATQILAVVGAGGASGNVQVNTPFGPGTLPGFTFVPAPTITSFTPMSGSPGNVITITGTNFTGATNVTVGGVPVSSFLVMTPTQISATLSTGASGSVSVFTPGGSASQAGFTFVFPMPTVTSFTPTSAASAATVSITGTNFYSVSQVRFGGVLASSWTVVSPTLITATLGAGASGAVTVTTPGGTAPLGGFAFVPAPAITSFSPASAPTGTMVTINGSNFTGVTQVRFGGVTAASFMVISPTQINALVGIGATGNLTITSSGGTATAVGFSYLPAPAIISFTPTAAGPGMTVTINGANFSGATQVQFGSVPAASHTVVSGTQITAVIAGGSSGSISVTSPAGTGLAAGFTFVPPPTISAVTPSTRGPGMLVVITGMNFTGATSVRFGGVPALSFTINSSTQISAIVGPGGASGNVTVQNPGGTGTFAGFTFVPAPTISAFTPMSAEPGETVIITGTNFTGVSGVFFGSITAASFTVLSPTQISAVVPGNAGGTIVVSAAGGNASVSGFVFVPAPTITSFSPMAALPGESVVINGTNLIAVTKVTFGGFRAKEFTITSPNRIVAVVSDFGGSGSVFVESPDGADSLAGFSFIFPIPTITDVSPLVGGPGMALTISGTGFIGASTASIGGVPVSSFRVVSPTQITAVIGSGATGSVAISTPGGAASLGGFRFFPSPVITGVTPPTASPGDTIVITGVNLGPVTSVLFGNQPAQNFVIVSSTEIRAVVPRGGGVLSVSSPGGRFASPLFTTIPPPIILTFTPTIAASGGTVSIRGQNFVGVRTVSFGTVPAGQFTVVGDTLIQANVGNGASGLVTVVTTSGTASVGGFRFILPPTITSFSPQTGGPGMFVTIIGTNLSDITSISIGGVTAGTISQVSATQIVVQIPTVATVSSNTIAITTLGGTVQRDGFTFVPTPLIRSFSPMTAPPGTTVTIEGENLGSVSLVSFGGVRAERFSIVSPTQITAVVANGSTGSVSVLSPGGTASLAGFVYVPPSPIVNSFSPTSAGVGATITILGENFIGVTGVSIGGMPVRSYSVVSPNQIVAVIGATANGSVSVTTETGTGIRQGFLFVPMPVITSFSPMSAGEGAEITIIGQNLSGTTQVSFGNVQAREFRNISPTEVKAIVSTGATGIVAVSTLGGRATAAGFVMLAAPRVTSFTPTSAAAGMTVTITGTNFANVRAVSFGGVETTNFTIVSSTQLRAIVPQNANNGAVSVITQGGSGSAPGFTVISAPTISDFAPKSSGVGATITITGTNFTSTATVRFGNTSARFTFISPMMIQAIVPIGTTGGNVSVTTLGGTASLGGFSLLNPPRVTGFSPTIASTGTLVIITGANFTEVVEVNFGSAQAERFTRISDTQIQAIVGTGASGRVSVTTLGGTAESSQMFAYLGAPTITGFTPASAGAGRLITIVGDGFTGARAVSFGDVPAARFTVVSPTQMTAIVGTGESGELSITTVGGTGSLRGFTFIPAPTIASFTPSNGAVGTTVTIRGTNLNDVSSVAVGGVSLPFSRISDGISVSIPLSGAATGAVSVSTPGGVAISDSNFTFVPPPTINAASLSQSRQGLIMQILGENFVGTTTVTIGRASVPFTVINQNQVNAAIQAGLTQNEVAVFTPGGVATNVVNVQQPRITDVTPSRGEIGAEIIITGQVLDGTSRVSIGGVDVPFEVINSGQILVRIPQGGTSGAIGLTTPRGVLTTTTTFTLITNDPIIVSFTPTQGDILTTVRVSGENLGQTTQVFIGGVAIPFTILSSRELQLRIPINATSGNIVVISPIGVAASTGQFVFAPAGTQQPEPLPPLAAGVLRCYPNPATDNITANYVLDKPQTVTIYLVDMKGKVFQTIEQGRQDKGEYTLQIPMLNYSVGTYILILEAGNRRSRAIITVVR